MRHFIFSVALKLTRTPQVRYSVGLMMGQNASFIIGSWIGVCNESYESTRLNLTHLAVLTGSSQN